MSNVLEPVPTTPTTPAPAAQLANRYTGDAQEWLARLRAMAEAFPDETDPRPLTRGEISIARQTSLTALEKAAVFAEATPQFSAAVAVVNELRDAISFEVAYVGVIDQARSMARRIELAILRRKLKASRAARALYRMGKSFTTADVGDSVKPLLGDMKRALVPTRRKKLVAPPTEVAVTVSPK